MSRLILFSILTLALTSCSSGSDKAQDSHHGFPCDTTWMVSKGESKTDVRNMLVNRGLRLQEDEYENILSGIGVRSISWAGIRWDVVSCRFDSSNKAKSVRLLHGGEIGDSIYNVVYELSRIYGEAVLDKSNSDKTWRFINTHNTNASITSDRNIEVNIVWE